MKVTVHKKVTKEIDLDTRKIAKDLINFNTGFIVDSLIDVFNIDYYLSENEELDEESRDLLYQLVSKELYNMLKQC